MNRGPCFHLNKIVQATILLNNEVDTITNPPEKYSHLVYGQRQD